MAAKNVYEALVDVKRKMDALGVGKDKRVTQGPAQYAYRSVDDIINAIAPMLTESGVVTSISYHDHHAEDVMIVTKAGERSGHRVSILCRITFWHANEDGVVTSVNTEGRGEGLDSGDKATNKAMSGAYKYALGLALPIPFVGRDDPDEDHAQLASKRQGQQGSQQGQSGQQQGRAPTGGGMPAEVLQGYLDRIAQAGDVNVLRGITSTGIKSAKEMGDVEAQAKILAAGKDKSVALKPPAQKVTEDGEVV